MQKTSLADLVEQHLAAARTPPAGRSAHTVPGGHDAILRQSLIALAPGQSLGDHESPAKPPCKYCVAGSASARATTAPTPPAVNCSSSRTRRVGSTLCRAASSC
ncbi:hypothetical protein Ait01nite_039800 [Actinoplanes italicus]|uniref:hypothetical protein n=1 Tax=Actinoplanes italicus TaxID=113567 RepID=UPI001A427A93|nr:hypothetical protein [Actinoplanes italicus]GIE30935.1 hypothetical protein Ait01nite_039800 [Actinoplanes italicus]